MADLATTAKALAYTHWVESVAGSRPTARDYGEYVAVEYTPEERQAMVDWLDARLWGAVRGDPGGDVRYNLGQILVPWAIRYAIPLSAGMFALGLVIGRMRR